MIKCIAIDDEPLALKQIAAYIKKTPYLELKEAFDNAIDALEFLQKNTIDLMFVDIDMPDLSGMDFVKSLNNAPKVIFTTAYSEYAVEGFQVDAADYLLKPIGYADFLKSTDKVKERYFTESNQEEVVNHDERYLFIKSEYRVIRLNYADIKYIEGMREYVRIFVDDQKPIMALMSIKKLEDHLPTQSFMRVHRSYIVNLDKIRTVERNRILFDNDTYISVSDQYKSKFQEYLNNHFLK